MLYKSKKQKENGMAKQKTGRLALQEVPEEGVPGHFAHGLNFYKLFWVFLIGCFAGVVVETVFVFLSNGGHWPQWR